MNSFWCLYLLVPVIIGLILTEYKDDIFRVIRARLFDESDLLSTNEGRPSDGWNVVVMIPSARENYERRMAIRSTWGQGSSVSGDQNRFLLKFVVGSRGCEIHPSDRLSEFSCERWRVDEQSLPANEKEERLAVTEVSVPDEPLSRIHGRSSLAFTVNYPVILTKLGAYRESVDGAKLSVKLLEAVTMREIVSTTLSKESPGVKVGSLRFRPVEQYLLPKGFHGLVVVESLEGSSVPHGQWNRNIATEPDRSSGIFQFYEDDTSLPDGHYEDVRRWNSQSVHLVSFFYKIPEVANLREHLAGESARSKEMVLNSSTLSASLSAEARQYGDIEFVDVVDVYRNVPTKVLRFAEWASKSLNFRYLLKADDDCFVDLERIDHRLDQLSTDQGESRTNVWLGRFRYNWLVEKYGKWAERSYPSQVYPRFACGSGYVLSYDIVWWLALTGHRLKTYQGEDVSMGIWLSAIGPTVIDEPLWQCDKECISDMYSMPQLHPDELKRIWEDRTACGDSCGCS